MASLRGGDQYHVDAQEFSALFREAKAVDKRLVSELRKQIRMAARPIVDEVKAEVQKPPPGGGKRSGKVTRMRSRKGVKFAETSNVRTAIARGVTTAISTAAGGGGVTIKARSGGLDARHKAMVRAYNKPSFRHPVFGTNEWVVQQGRPYFGSVIMSRRNELQKAVRDALDIATTSLRKHR